MPNWEEMSTNRRLFDLGARTGSLEGYLYTEDKVDKSYLKGWLENIGREFQSLPSPDSAEVKDDYTEVLMKIHALLKRLFGDQDPHALSVEKMIRELKDL